MSENSVCFRPEVVAADGCRSARGVRTGRRQGRLALVSGRVVGLGAFWVASVLFWVALVPTESRSVERGDLGPLPFKWIRSLVVPVGWTCLAGALTVSVVRGTDSRRRANHAVDVLVEPSGSSIAAFSGPVSNLFVMASSGLLLGLAQVSERSAPLAWVGLAGTAWAVSTVPGAMIGCSGLLVSALLDVGVSQHWVYQTISKFPQTESYSVPLLFASTVAAIGLTRRLPIAWALLLVCRHGSGGERRTWLWLPLTWIIGEGLCDWVTGYPAGEFLYSQWRVRAVLTALGWVGWYPTLFLALSSVVLLTEHMRRRGFRSRTSASAFAGLLWLSWPGGSIFEGESPTIPKASPNARARLADLGVLQLATFDARPEALPENLDVLIWPEGFLSGYQPGEEGPQADSEMMPIDELIGRPRLGHLVNRLVRSTRGMYNASVATDPEGRPFFVRGKTGLVPGGESPIAGITPQGLDGGYARGTITPLVTFGEHRIIPVICFEAYHRSIVAKGKKAGGRLISVQAGDLPFCGNRAALRQSIGALALRAAEFGLPAVRSSLQGSAAIIDEDGTLLLEGPPGTTAVLRINRHAP